MTEASIDPSHYDFARYVDIKRWSSYWHQVHETLSLRPKSVLEVGVGTGLYKSALQALHCPVTSIDINPDLAPDHVGSVTALPFDDASFSVVVAFQVLEHLPYGDFRRSIAEMRRVAAEHVVISLPDARKVWRATVDFGKGERRWLMVKPRWRPRVHRVTGDHQWEINKQGYPVERIVADLQACGLEVLRNFEVPQNPYHRVFVCRKTAAI
jgi:ubiquinone/menaquinone biosynthesis C-methylase UbiE